MLAVMLFKAILIVCSMSCVLAADPLTVDTTLVDVIESKRGFEKNRLVAAGLHEDVDDRAAVTQEAYLFSSQRAVADGQRFVEAEARLSVSVTTLAQGVVHMEAANTDAINAKNAVSQRQGAIGNCLTEKAAIQAVYDAMVCSTATNIDSRRAMIDNIYRMCPCSALTECRSLAHICANFADAVGFEIT
eukprot:ANDGO_00836.mRNA.1 hypothetical protein